VKGNNAGARRLAICGLLLVAMLGTSAQAQWLRAESQNVVVYSDSDEKRVRAFVQKLERFHALLALRMPGRTPDVVAPLTVYLVRNRRDLMRAVPGAHHSLGGMYVPSASGVRAIAVAEHADRREDDDVLLKSYTRHFMSQRYPQGGPIWIIRGFSEYFGTADVEGQRITVGEPSRWRAYQLMADYDNWIDFEEILNGSVWERDSDQVSLAYAQSWLLTHYLLASNERWAAAQEVFAALRNGESVVKAFEQHLGLDMRALRAELRLYAGRQIRFSVLDVEFPEVPVSITSLSEAADRVMLPNIAIELGARDGDTLARVREAFARHPTDPFAVECRARAEAAAGDPQRALDLLAPLLAGTDARAEHHYLAGMAQLSLAARALKAPDAITADANAARVAAANHFAGAIQADDTDYRSLYRYWQIRIGNGDAPDMRLQDVLVQAYNLAPQVQEIALSTGVMLLSVKRIVEARVVLNKLAGDPHGESASRTARRLVTVIDALPTGREPTNREIADAMAQAAGGSSADTGDDASDTAEPEPEPAPEPAKPATNERTHLTPGAHSRTVAARG
jgi:hypothetical protein